MTRTELTNIARGIFDRQFPGEWESFTHSGLETILDIYDEMTKDDNWSPEEALIHFKVQVFEAGKENHEDFDSDVISYADQRMLCEM